MFDKRRFRRLLHFILNFEVDDHRTHQDIAPRQTTTRDLFRHFDLGPEVMEFAVHAMALQHSEESVILNSQRKYTKTDEKENQGLKFCV